MPDNAHERLKFPHKTDFGGKVILLYFKENQLIDNCQLKIKVTN